MVTELSRWGGSKGMEGWILYIYLEKRGGSSRMIFTFLTGRECCDTTPIKDLAGCRRSDLDGVTLCCFCFSTWRICMCRSRMKELAMSVLLGLQLTYPWETYRGITNQKSAPLLPTRCWLASPNNCPVQSLQPTLPLHSRLPPQLF